jgi:hypothetical protein
MGTGRVALLLLAIALLQSLLAPPTEGVVRIPLSGMEVFSSSG